MGKVEAYRFDLETGLFVEPVMVEKDNVPEDCTLKVWKEPCFYPKWNFETEEWDDTGEALIVIIEE